MSGVRVPPPEPSFQILSRISRKWGPVESPISHHNIMNEPSNRSLLRLDAGQNFSPKKVVIVGNGAVENGDRPLIRVLRDQQNSYIAFDPSEELDRFLKHEKPSVPLSHAAFLYRSAGLNVIRSSDGGSPEDVAAIRELNKFRCALAKEYSDSRVRGEISLRTLPHEIEKIISDSSTGVITINWDELLWHDPRIKNLIQLHGRSGWPESLIFPTEYAVDEFTIFSEVLAEMVHAESKKLKAKIDSCGRNPSAREQLRTRHRDAIEWMQAAEELIIWGVAFHPYDAELTSVTILARHEISNKKRVILINKRKEDRDIAAALLRVPDELRIDNDGRPDGFFRRWSRRLFTHFTWLSEPKCNSRN